MNAREKVNRWLMELGVIVDKQFRLNEEGIFVADNSEGQEFIIEVPEEESKLVYLYAPIADIPSKNREACLEQLLSWNLYGTETQQCTLSIDKEAGKIILHYASSIEALDAISFSNLFNNFIESVDKIKADWSDFCNNLPETATSFERRSTSIYSI